MIARCDNRGYSLNGVVLYNIGEVQLLAKRESSSIRRDTRNDKCEGQ